MATVTRPQLNTLKHQLHDARSHILDAERAYREAGDSAGATRAEALACQLSAEIDYLDLLLNETTPRPTPVQIQDSREIPVAASRMSSE